MEISLITLQQTAVMLLYVAGGYLLFRTKKISAEGSRSLASMLITLIIPCVIVRSFCVEPTAEKIGQLAQSALLAALSLLLAMLAAALIYRKNPIDNFSSAFSNAGFIGIPLIQATLGEEAVFYIVAYVALLSILQWSYGVYVLTRRRELLKIKPLLWNPIVGGTVIGLVLFFTGWGVRLPSVLNTALSGAASLNAPIAMMVLGIYLAQTPIRSMLTTPRLYAVCAVRLLLIPLATLALLLAIPAPNDLRLALLLTAAAPIGANVAVYAQLHNLDYAYACKAVTLSTLLSCVTLPLFPLLFTALTGM